MKKKFITIGVLIASFLMIAINIITPKFCLALSNSDDYSAKALFLMDFNTNQVLFKKNSDTKIPVASIVKLMTIYLTCEEINAGRLKLDDVVTVSENASSMGGSQVFIETNGEYSVGDLLKSCIVSSANDASVALAETIAGNEENFVVLMNKTAQKLGMTNTNYVNCTGLPAGNQFSCAKDTAILLKEVLKNDIYHNYSTIWMDTLKHPKGRESELVNTNKLIRYYEGCDGGKTGSTSEAGYCLAATAKRNSMRLIAVVLGAENGKARFAETSKLLNFGFANFENKMIVDKNVVLTEKIKVKNGQKTEVNVKPQENLYIIAKKRENSDDINTVVKINDTISAPVKVGEIVGTIYLTKNGEVVSQTNIVCTENINKSSFYDNVNKTIQNWKVFN